MKPERVLFRYWPKYKGVIAFLPDVTANLGTIMSYEHIGQHGEADYWGLLSETRPATPIEYADLLAEINSLGYQTTIRRRLSYASLYHTAWRWWYHKGAKNDKA